MSVFTDDDGGVKPWVTYAIIGIAIFAGGYFVYGAWRKSGSPTNVNLMCYSCEYVSDRELTIGETFPAKCPKCDKDTFVPAFRCPQCQTPNVWNEDRGLKPPTKCRKCGAESRHG